MNEVNENNIENSVTDTSSNQANDIMSRVLEFRDNAHADNVKKLKAGIKCIFTVPACFLILLFFTGSSKIIFLVLWIASLFIIAAYLIHVEYSDYKIQEMVNSLHEDSDSIDSLIDIDSIYTKVSAPKKKLDDKLDNIITNVKADTQAQLDSLAQLHSDIRDHVAARRSGAEETSESDDIAKPNEGSETTETTENTENTDPADTDEPNRFPETAETIETALATDVTGAAKDDQNTPSTSNEDLSEQEEKTP